MIPILFNGFVCNSQFLGQILYFEYIFKQFYFFIDNRMCGLFTITLASIPGKQQF